MPAGTSIVRLKRHYFFLYGVFGCVSPYMSLYLRQQKNLEPAQIGTIFALAQSSVLFMPALATYVADRHRLVRPLMMGFFALTAVSFFSLSLSAGFLACAVFYCLGALANTPQTSLSDGLLFAMQQSPVHAHVPYAEVRVWGTMGYIAPSLGLFVAFKLGADIGWVPVAAVISCVLGIINARGLPHRLTLARPASGRMPTWQALRVLARPSVAVFCLGVGLITFSNAAYYTFYPLYLTQVVGLDAQWVGMVAVLGVALELVYLPRLQWAQQRIGFPGLLAIGGVGILLRMVCLAYLPSPLFAVGLQVMHGWTTIGYLMVPVLYLNSLAGDEFRNSIQGLFVMLMSGVFLIGGNLVAGHFAQIGLVTMYRVALGIAVAGLALVALSFALPHAPAKVTAGAS